MINKYIYLIKSIEKILNCKLHIRYYTSSNILWIYQMNNRIAGLWILTLIFWLGYLFYWYYFVYSLVNISFISNIEKYTIQMESSQRNYNFECDIQECSFPQISPFEYSVTLKSESYKELKYTWKVTKNTSVQNITFEKDFQLVKTNLLSQEKATEILDETINSLKEETMQEKIQKLKDKQKNYLLIKTDNDTEYIFRISGNSLSLYQNNKFLWNFDFAEKSDISLKEILWNKDYLAINIKENKYLFSKQTGKLNQYILDIPIKYIKSTSQNGQFIFVTEKWSFEYYLYKNIFVYNTFFSDFVFFDKNSFVWIVQENETEKRKRFAYENIENKTLIIQYFPDTKEKNILLQTDKNIEKIFKSAGLIYLQDNNKITFQLSHLQE